MFDWFLNMPLSLYTKITETIICCMELLLLQRINSLIPVIKPFAEKVTVIKNSFSKTFESMLTSGKLWGQITSEIYFEIHSNGSHLLKLKSFEIFQRILQTLIRSIYIQHFSTIFRLFLLTPVKHVQAVFFHSKNNSWSKSLARSKSKSSKHTVMSQWSFLSNSQLSLRFSGYCATFSEHICKQWLYIMYFFVENCYRKSL